MELIHVKDTFKISTCFRKIINHFDAIDKHGADTANPQPLTNTYQFQYDYDGKAQYINIETVTYISTSKFVHCYNELSTNIKSLDTFNAVVSRMIACKGSDMLGDGEDDANDITIVMFSTDVQDIIDKFINDLLRIMNKGLFNRDIFLRSGIDAFLRIDNELYYTDFVRYCALHTSQEERFTGYFRLGRVEDFNTRFRRPNVSIIGGIVYVRDFSSYIKVALTLMKHGQLMERDAFIHDYEYKRIRESLKKTAPVPIKERIDPDDKKYIKYLIVSMRLVELSDTYDNKQDCLISDLNFTYIDKVSNARKYFLRNATRD